jgi:hypothetical protein
MLFVTKYFMLLEEDSNLDREETLHKIILGLNRSFSGLFLSDSEKLYVTSQYAHAVDQPVPIVRFQISTDYMELELDHHNEAYIDKSIATLRA